jgi:hypothetical protein
MKPCKPLKEQIGESSTTKSPTALFQDILNQEVAHIEYGDLDTSELYKRLTTVGAAPDRATKARTILMVKVIQNSDLRMLLPSSEVVSTNLNRLQFDQISHVDDDTVSLL